MEDNLDERKIDNGQADLASIREGLGQSLAGEGRAASDFLREFENVIGLIEGLQYLPCELIADKKRVPESSGIYGWWFDEVLNVPREGCLFRGGRHLLYVGIANLSLRDRIINNHLRGNAEGSTLRRALGVLNGFELRRVGKTGKRLTFSVQEQALTEWMQEHVCVTWATHREPGVVERLLLASSAVSLPLNLDQNAHAFGSVLSELKRNAADRARLLPILPK